MNRVVCVAFFMSLLPMQIYAVDECAGVNSPGNPYVCLHSNEIDEGNCVWWAGHMRPDTQFTHLDVRRDAENWIWYAEQNDLPISQTPVVGSIVVFENQEPQGHVAYVVSINDDDTFNVSEMGYDWFDGVRNNTYSMTDLGGVSGFILGSSEWFTICGANSCEISSQEFSDGSKVGWYPEGDCTQAEKWFGIGLNGDEYVPISSLQQGDTCICR